MIGKLNFLIASLHLGRKLVRCKLVTISGRHQICQFLCTVCFIGSYGFERFRNKLLEHSLHVTLWHFIF